MARLPLEGIRIADLTIAWAGPFGTMMLGDLGAEVIKVETIHHFATTTRGIMARPPKSAVQPGSWYGRSYVDIDAGERPWDRTVMFNRTARNKLSCCMDLRRPQGKDVLRRLVEVSDVFIENNAAATMEKLSLTYEVVSGWNPRIIYVNNPGLGMSGPYKYYVGLGLNFEGMTGHTWLRGYPDRDHPMHNTPLYHMDASGGACGAFAVLAALHYRNRTGKGQYIDIAGAETVIPHFGEAFMDYTMNRRVQRSIGNRDIHGAAPCGCYRSRGGPDEWVVITVGSDEEWQGLCRAMGNPPWSSDKRFSDVLGRWKNQDELDRLIEEWTNRHDKYETMVVLEREGVPALPVIGARDAHHDPQLTARSFLEVINHRETGVHLYPGFQWKYSKTPLRVRFPPPCLGEHNDYVFREVLGMPEDEVVKLEGEQIIGGDAFIEELTPSE